MVPPPPHSKLQQFLFQILILTCSVFKLVLLYTSCHLYLIVLLLHFHYSNFSVPKHNFTFILFSLIKCSIYSTCETHVYHIGQCWYKPGTQLTKLPALSIVGRSDWCGEVTARSVTSDAIGAPRCCRCGPDAVGVAQML